MAGLDDFVNGRFATPAQDQRYSGIEDHVQSGFQQNGVTPEPDSSGTTHAKALGIGAGATGAAALLGFGLRKFFPGVNPNKSFLKELDSTLRKEHGQGLKEHFPQYLRFTLDSGKTGADAPTFADYLAWKSVNAPNTMALLRKTQQQGGGESTGINRALGIEPGKPANVISSGLLDRSEGHKERVLDELAQTLGIPKQTLLQSQEELLAERSKKAKPLYDAAFKDKNPIRDTNLLGLFNNKAMTDALKHAEDIADLKGRGISTRYASDPSRKDAWKRLLTSEVPEELFTGPEAAGLRQYISPNTEELHHAREALWDLYKKNKIADPAKANVYRDNWKSLTEAMDKYAAPEYQQARKQYKSDSDLLSAHEIGAELFKQNPADLRKKLATMSPDERTALARGFVGSLMDMQDPKFVRELISGQPKYARQRELLSAVFPNTSDLHRFLHSLAGEESTLAGEAAFTPAGTVSPSGNSLVKYLRGIWDTSGSPRIAGVERMHFPPYDPFDLTSRAGSRMMFETPKHDPMTGGIIENPEIARYLGKWPQNPLRQAAIPGGLGAATGIGYDLVNQRGGLRQGAPAESEELPPGLVSP